MSTPSHSEKKKRIRKLKYICKTCGTPTDKLTSCIPCQKLIRKEEYASTRKDKAVKKEVAVKVKARKKSEPMFTTGDLKYYLGRAVDWEPSSEVRIITGDEFTFLAEQYAMRDAGRIAHVR